VSSVELRATSLGVDVEGQVLLHDVNLMVSSGEMLVITGPSGSGKTTLALTLGGVVEPDRGEVRLAGTPLSMLKDYGDRPALVTQDFGLVPVLTAAETVGLPLQARAFERDAIRERTTRWLSALGLSACADRTVAELSGGQRQRVAIARALAKDSNVLIMDEPTAELDPTNRALLLTLLSDELARGAAVVVVSHEADVIERADKVFAVPKLR
jgi:putative ABC transport system ATP-binding protein